MILRAQLQDDEVKRQRRKRRNHRYITLSLLKKRILEGKLPRCSAVNCAQHAIPATRHRRDGTTYATGSPGEILIKYIDDQDHGRHGYSHCHYCASGHICPVCAEIIRYNRLMEIRQAVSYMYGQGYTLAHIIYTARHNYRTKLKDFIPEFRDAMRDFQKSGSYLKYKSLMSSKYSISAVEVTDDHPDAEKKTGWHYHKHQIDFVRPGAASEAQIVEVEARLREQWRRSLRKYGLDADLEHGLRIQFVAVDDADDAQAVRALGDYVAKAMSWELSGQPIKQGRGDYNRRITSWQLQRIVLERDDKRLYKRYADYIEGMKGVNWIRFSPGLREFCGISNKSDREIVEQHNATGEEVYSIGERFPGYIYKNGHQGCLLDVADVARYNQGGEYVPDAIRRYLQMVNDDEILLTYEYDIINKSTGEVIA